jgi:hypothetical protein
MLQPNSMPSPQSRFTPVAPSVRKVAPSLSGDTTREARVKPEFVHLYPGVDPKTWYRVVQEGEYRDDMEGLWIQVTDWVTYVLAKHFDLQDRPGVN